MSVYDTRFLIEYFYSGDDKVLQKAKLFLRRDNNKCVSAVVLHEVYNLTLAKEGRQTAELRSNILEKEFKVVSVDAKLAVASAELRHKYRVPMADSIIAATAQLLSLPCVTDDPHITSIKEIRTLWL